LTKLQYEAGSFRDPAGRVFYHNSDVYREIKKTGLERINFLQENDLLGDLIEKKFIVKTEIIREKDNFNLQKNNIAVLKHEKIEFISYPYEWTFDQLKDAAIFHLNFQIYLLKKNAKLLDASAYNIQFKNNKPIFIDVLSIDKYTDGEFWYGHKQFCENFLNPLLLKSKKGIDFNNWFKGNLEGISTNEISNLLSWYDFFSYTIFFHVFMLNKVETNTKKNPKTSHQNTKNFKNLKKQSFIAILNQLKNYIKKLTPKKLASTWDKYSYENTYNIEEEKIKLEIVKDFCKTNKINLLADFGCNEGKFSEYAANNGVNVIGFDFDLNVLNRAFRKAKNSNSKFFPLFSDFTNPSSNLGWNNSERQSLVKRGKFDASISLALIHHLVIAKNIPIEDAIRWLVSFSPIGLIEFVPKNDPTTKIMMTLKGDIFPDYNEKNFEKILSSIKNIKKITKITNSDRKIYEFTDK
jgi:ribosomal protein L11 methylase PrmA